mmetsp:Transcript_8631/g.19911  ORF Transcript_8631/g.19911 Transcript_8631/m.19911 type:complete len:367 (+) Transcript_8631:46-1146(+)
MANGAHGAQGSGTGWEPSIKVSDDELRKKRLPILSVANTGEMLMTISSRPAVKLWRISEEAVLANGSLVKGAAAPSSLAVNQEGRVGVCTQDGDILLWDLRTTEPTQLAAPMENRGLLHFLPDNNRLATAGVSGKLYIWDLRRNQVEREINANSGPQMKNGDERPRKLPRITAYTSPITALLASSDGVALACGRTSGSIGLLRLRTLEWASADLQAHTMGAVRSLSFEQTTNVLFSGGDDRNVCLMDAARWISHGQRPQLQRFPAHRARITGLQLCPDSFHPALISTAWDNMVKIWDYKKQSVLQTFSTHKGGVTGMAFDPDGRNFVTVGADAGIQLYVPTHQPFTQPRPPQVPSAQAEDVKVKPG